MIFEWIKTAKQLLYKNGKNVEEALDEVNENLNVKYNPDTDIIQVNRDGSWVNWQKANLVAFDGKIFKQGTGALVEFVQDVSVEDSATVFSIGTDMMYMQVYPGALATFATLEKYDLSKYSQLTIKYKLANQNSSYAGTFSIGLSNTNENDNTFTTTLKSGAVSNTDVITETFNISAYKTKRHIKFQINRKEKYGYTDSIYVYECYLS